MADDNGMAALGLSQLDAERFIDFVSAISPSIAEYVRTLHRLLACSHLCHNQIRTKLSQVPTLQHGTLFEQEGVHAYTIHGSRLELVSSMGHL